MKTLREEELPSTPNPSVYIDYSKTQFSQSPRLELWAIEEFLIDTTLES